MGKWKVPHTLVLLFGMIVVAYVLTWIVPQGEFDRVENASGRQQVVDGSYHQVEKPKLPIEAIFTSIPKGFQGAAQIIFFVFIVGGAFGVLRATGTVDATIALLLRHFGDKPLWLVIGGVVLFAVGSSTIGMAEEYLPFVPIIITLCIALGLDAVTAVGIMVVGYGIGYGTATINPFTVLIAQGVAEVPPGSAVGYKLVLMVLFIVVGVHHVWSYARKVKANPEKSLVHGIEPPSKINKQNDQEFTLSHKVVLGGTILALVIMVYGVKSLGWYLNELMALFLLLSIFWAFAAWMSPDNTAKAFCEGASELTTTALLIGVARTIELVLNEGHVVDTIIHSIAQPLSALGPSLAAIGMFVFQSICNFFIPSGSGQALVTMPVMAPLGDLVGVSRQTAVLAFQFGDGFTNMLVPTNAVLVGILAMAGIPYEKWLRFILPFMLKVWVMGALAMVIAVLIGF